MKYRLGIGIASLLGAWPLTAGTALGYADFRDVDYIYAQDPGRFRSLWQDATERTVRVAVIGDSQETSPGGAGRVYIPRLNWEMYQRFGNVPETQVVGFSSFGGGNPPAEWLLQGGAAGPGPAPSRLSPGQMLPGIVPAAHTATSGKNSAIGQYYGQLLMLQHDARNLDPENQIAAQSYLDPGGVIKAQIFAATNASSGEIFYRARPTSQQISYFAPVTTSGKVSLGLESSEFAIRSGYTAPLDYAGQKYMAIEISGDSDTKLTDIIGARFVNTSRPEGVVFSDVAAGGYRTIDFLERHADAGPLYAALGFDAAVVHLGANDSQYRTAAEYRGDLEALIARLREWTGDPNYRVILIAEPDHLEPIAARRAVFDQHAGIQKAIAEADANVLFINERRMMYEHGWDARNPEIGRFLTDGVHYTGEGGRLLSRIEAAALLGEPLPAPTWQGGAGAWADASQWIGGFPNAAGSKAVFAGAGGKSAGDASAVEVTLDVERTIGHLAIESSTPHRLMAGGAGAIRLDNDGRDATVNVSGGRHRIEAPMVFADTVRMEIATAAGLDAQSVRVLDGRRVIKRGRGEWVVENDLSMGAGAQLRVEEGQVGAGRIRGGKVQLIDSAGMVLLGSVAEQRISRIAGLEVAGDARLDLGESGLIVEAAGEDSQAMLGRLFGYIGSARNAETRWGGPGIGSSALDADGLATVGVFLNDDGQGGPFFESFAGEAVPVGAVVVTPVLAGDLNLDGVVNGDDYRRMDQGYRDGLGGFQHGDIDYSGSIDANDYFLLDRAALRQRDLALGAAPAVPEPAAAILLAAGASFLLCRRKSGGLADVACL